MSTRAAPSKSWGKVRMRSSVTAAFRSSTEHGAVNPDGVCGELTGRSVAELFAESKAAGYGEVMISRDRIVFRLKETANGNGAAEYVRAHEVAVPAEVAVSAQVGVQVEDEEGSTSPKSPGRSRTPLSRGASMLKILGPSAYEKKLADLQNTLQGMQGKVAEVTKRKRTSIMLIPGASGREHRVSDRKVEEKVELDEGMWDTALLIGTSPWGPTTTVYLTILFLLNVLMQGGYITILVLYAPRRSNSQHAAAAHPLMGYSLIHPLARCSTDLTKVQYTDDDVVALRDWRRSVAHDISYIVESKSLAHRVCANNRGLHLSGRQVRVAAARPTAPLARHWGSRRLVCTRSTVRPCTTLLLPLCSHSAPTPLPLRFHSVSPIPCHL